ncbi:hypothetical protein ACSQ67_001913 [Phaseolus vulgaris]
MPTPPPARPARPTPAPTNDFNRPIPTGVAVPLASSSGSTLAPVGDDRSFSRVVSFKPPSNIEGEIRSVLDDDLLDGDIEMIRRDLFSARRGERSEEPVEDISRLEHDLQEAEHNLKRGRGGQHDLQKKLCAQAAEPEPRRIGWPSRRRPTPTKLRRLFSFARHWRRPTVGPP